MIDFALPGDVELAADTARRFAAEVLVPGEREHEAARAVSAPVRAQAEEIGFDRVEWPEALGGAGLGCLARVAVLEALGAGDPAAALALDPLNLGYYVLDEFAGREGLLRFGFRHGDTPAARAGGAPPLRRQEDPAARTAFAFAGDEPLRFENLRIRGSFPWVPAQAADQVVLLDRQQAALVCEGFTLEPVRGAGLLAAGAAGLRLDDAPVIARWSDERAAARALARARLHVAALVVGQLGAAAEYSRRYALDRVAFGKPIAHHQALAFLIVDMASAVEAARALLREAAWRADRNLPYVAEAAAAFVEAAEAAAFVGPNAVQILGAAGFMRDHRVEKMMRESRLLTLMLGGVDAAREDALADLDAGHPVPRFVEPAPRRAAQAAEAAVDGPGR